MFTSESEEKIDTIYQRKRKTKIVSIKCKMLYICKQSEPCEIQVCTFLNNVLFKLFSALCMFIKFELFIYV